MTTAFTWGYWGWGNATAQLVEAMDTVEGDRGFGPPHFVDVRLFRNVRATGFRDDAFEKLVGGSRYTWLPELGNAAVREGGIRIKEPAAAERLLDLILKCERGNRRVVFFCACEHPRNEGQPRACHRATVAGLLLKAASSRSIDLTVVEWPGGDPPKKAFELEVPAAEFEKVLGGATSVALPAGFALVELAAVPWLSLVRIRNARSPKTVSEPLVTGPAQYRRGKWCLPNLGYLDMPEHEVEGFLQQERADLGYLPRRPHQEDSRLTSASRC